MPTPVQIVIVENSPEDAELMVAELRRAGFALQWRAELDRTHVSDIETGARNPSLQCLEKPAKSLKMSFFNPVSTAGRCSGPRWQSMGSGRKNHLVETYSGQVFSKSGIRKANLTTRKSRRTSRTD